MSSSKTRATALALLFCLALAAGAASQSEPVPQDVDDPSPLVTQQQRIEQERYWFNRRGLQFGVPPGAYRRAVEQMRQMEADPGNFAWQFIGPQPVLGVSQPFAGAVTKGARFNAAGRVTAIAADPTEPERVFVGTANGGVWMTTDGGTTFAPISDSLPTQAIGAIALDAVNEDPPAIYVGTGEANGIDSYYRQGIFRSTDLGGSWVELGPGTCDNVSFSRLAVDTSTNPSAIYAAIGVPGSTRLIAHPTVQVGGLVPGPVGLWRSTDGGES